MSNCVAAATILVALCVGGCAGVPNDPQSNVAATKSAYARPAPLTDGAAAIPPAGYVGFCARTPSACTDDSAIADAKVAVDDRTAETLVSVNDHVNDAIAYEGDMEHYGVANRWMLDPEDGRGDCKDYALAKREALRAAGLPDRALRIAIVRTAQDELHAVLTVDTDRGVLVMDSLTPEIRPWSDAPYRWLERQAADNPMHWVAVPGDDREAQGAVLAENVKPGAP